MARWIEDFRFWPRDRIHVNCVNIWHEIGSFREKESSEFYIFCGCMRDLNELEKNLFSVTDSGFLKRGRQILSLGRKPII